MMCDLIASLKRPAWYSNLSEFTAEGQQFLMHRSSSTQRQFHYFVAVMSTQAANGRRKHKMAVFACGEA